MITGSLGKASNNEPAIGAVVHDTATAGGPVGVVRENFAHPSIASVHLSGAANMFFFLFFASDGCKKVCHILSQLVAACLRKYRSGGANGQWIGVKV